jgi:hypothetical protein
LATTAETSGLPACHVATTAIDAARR